MTKKCGYIALLGRPNAGKSTLLNSCIGGKIAVVSSKPQTTRNKILGICVEEKSQLLFLDTPGIHNASQLHQLNKTMNKLAWSVVGDADVVCYLVSSDAGWQEEDDKYFEGILERSQVPVIVFLSQSDRKKKDEIFELNAMLEAQVEKVVERVKAKLGDRTSKISLEVLRPVSAKRPEEVKTLNAYFAKMLPESEWLYPEDDLTDLPEKFVCGELIREQMFRNFSAELPYVSAVRIDLFEHKGNIVNIAATIAVQRDSHKKMVIGKGGSAIKGIGIAARESLEKHLGTKVFLELFVKVEKDWNNDARLIAEYAALDEKDFVK